MASCLGHVVDCSDRNACDVEVLLGGGFSPLTGFMGQQEYASVLQHQRYSIPSAPFPSCMPPGGFTRQRRYALKLQHHQPKGMWPRFR